MDETSEDFYFTLTTQRDKDLDANSDSFFRYECVIAAIAVCYFRLTIKSYRNEPLPLRIVFALLLGLMAYFKKPYEIICAIQMFSYAMPIVLVANIKHLARASLLPGSLVRLLLLLFSAVASLVLSHVLLSSSFLSGLALITPVPIKNTVCYFFPLKEMSEAYDTILLFVDKVSLDKLISWLLFVTFNIQVGMGYLGIEFLRKEQQRRNDLIRLDMNVNDDSQPHSTAPTKSAFEGVRAKARNNQMEKARRFQRGAVPFILLTAAPYMLQIIALGNINFFAYTCFEHDIHRAVRLNKLFSHDSYLVAMANDSATPPQAFGQSMDAVVSTNYEIFNRKLFSLPKILLLPGIIMRQPLLVIQITPLIFGSDYIKARVMAFLTTNIEKFRKQSMEIESIRSKIESFDLKNAEILQRSGTGATQFTKKRWEDLTAQIQDKSFMASFLTRTKNFFSFIQRQFVFSVLIDCALAQLIAIGKIASADTFVFSRAIEDSVDTVLMKSRAESELARMLTEIEKLRKLSEVFDQSRDQLLLPCSIAPQPDSTPNIVLRNLHYSRGSASVDIDDTVLKAGIYALTGANGSGKSTLFRVLMSCNTNEKPTDLPSSISFSNDVCVVADASSSTGEGVCVSDPSEKNLKPEIIMPSSDVSEISQTFYWPLYTRPIDWIYQSHLTNEQNIRSMSLKVAQLLQDLDFRQIKTEGNETEIVTMPTDVVAEELIEEKEDWFNDLSGGQKSKVELVRKVFIHDVCPSVLLIDETMAPLDPNSKSLVMSKLKAFCKGSIIIVIYHTDVRGSDDEEKFDECVPSNNFFDGNIHLESRTINMRALC
mmetsp:Transcript_30627/g.46378  ORF Transcript_30627/g.46378 Transcript_30627/m.46378 type:complete len:824 (+) Transcript_30627:25-2496(+)